MDDDGAQHVTTQLSAASPDRVIGAETRRPFGETVQRALDYTPPALPDALATAGAVVGARAADGVVTVANDDADAASGIDESPAPATADEWIWRLAEDTWPKHEALQRLLSTV